MQEKRQSKRMSIDVSIKMRAIEENSDSKVYEVDVQNVSKGGMAFRCKEPLQIDKFYDAQIIIWTKERIDAVIQIVRKQGDDIYGCQFIGMPAADSVKIEIYEMFNYPENSK